MRGYIRQNLENLYKVSESKNGPEGLRKAVENIPDLVITDLMMPIMDGLELCKLLKSNEKTSHIPVIMLTAKAGMDNKIIGLEMGADVYLTKPFHIPELLIHIKNLITQRNNLKKVFAGVQNFHPKEINWPTLDQKFLDKLLQLLEDQYQNPGFGIAQMQEHLSMSKTQLHRKMKALTGIAPGEFLRNF